jgi:flavin-binding protein dodecin
VVDRCRLYAAPATEDPGREEAMSVARVTEITSSSKKSFQDAIELGIARAAKTLKNVEGAWIQDQKVVVEDGKISAYRVNMKVTFILAE